MFNEYLKKVLPIPIINIEISQKNNYLYRITTYSSIINEWGTTKSIEQRVRKNKRIKSISGWFFKEGDTYYKQAIVEFVRK